MNEERTMTEIDIFGDTILSTVADAMKMKRKMLEAGTKRAKVKCPRCDGMLHGRLSGSRNHIHMHCDGPCKRTIME
jgi:hypothetical protein